jgi:hypothetical protein
MTHVTALRRAWIESISGPPTRIKHLLLLHCWLPVCYSNIIPRSSCSTPPTQRLKCVERDAPYRHDAFGSLVDFIFAVLCLSERCGRVRTN